MFQFSGFASVSYVFTQRWRAYARRVSPFGHLWITACLQAPQSFSHATTSFIASYCLGIHRMRLFTWPYNPNTSGSSRFRLIDRLYFGYIVADMFADFCLRTIYCFYCLPFVFRHLTFNSNCNSFTYWSLPIKTWFTDFHIVKELSVRIPML